MKLVKNVTGVVWSCLVDKQKLCLYPLCKSNKYIYFLIKHLKTKTKQNKTKQKNYYYRRRWLLLLSFTHSEGEKKIPNEWKEVEKASPWRRLQQIHWGPNHLSRSRNTAGVTDDESLKSTEWQSEIFLRKSISPLPRAWQEWLIE